MDIDSLLSFVTDQGIVGAAFIYLLWYFVNRNNKMLENMVKMLKEFGDTLHNVSDTLARIDKRVELLEDKVEYLEGHQYEQDSDCTDCDRVASRRK